VISLVVSDAAGAVILRGRLLLVPGSSRSGISAAWRR